MASTQWAHEWASACRRLGGASDVMSGRRFKYSWLIWRRRCMASAAISGGNAEMCEVVRVRCTVAARQRADSSVRKFWLPPMRREGSTAHWNSPSRRSKGRSIAQWPFWVGKQIALVPANLASTPESSHIWSTEIRVSVKEGTHRTFRKISRRNFPWRSRASKGKSPIREMRCFEPSAATIHLMQGLVLIMSDA